MVVGVPGSGKTTVGRRIAAALGAPFIELDALYHQPGWTELARDDFRERVTQGLEASSWVVDGNYSPVRDLVFERADGVVWLDLPRPLVMRRVIRRTLRRTVTRERLWNGNREPLTNLCRLDPERNIIRWAWMQHAGYVERYEQEMGEADHRGVRFVRLRTPEEVDHFLDRWE